MSQPTPLKPRTRRSPQWSQPEEQPHRILKLYGMRQAALLCALALLVVCYAGPLNQEATTVLAAKRELPVYSVEREDKVITVSFDASWGGTQTLRILDLLDEYNAKATFFLVGIWVDKYPELVQEIHNRGHEIGNHSDSHPEMSKLSQAKIIQELNGCSDKIEALTGERPTSFRPPYGDYDNEAITTVRSQGLEAVQWSIDSLDWKNKGVDDLIRRATANVQPGDIILFHNDSKYILDALPTVLKYYQEQGFTMIPARDILLEGETTIDVQGKQHPAAGKNSAE